LSGECWGGYWFGFLARNDTTTHGRAAAIDHDGLVRLRIRTAPRGLRARGQKKSRADQKREHGFSKHAPFLASNIFPVEILIRLLDRGDICARTRSTLRPRARPWSHTTWASEKVKPSTMPLMKTLKRNFSG
jgi:hypothetical protein